MKLDIRPKLELVVKATVKVHVQGNVQVQVKVKVKDILQFEANC